MIWVLGSLGFGVSGLWGSWVSGFFFSWVFDFWVHGFLGFFFLGFLIFGFMGFWVYRFFGSQGLYQLALFLTFQFDGIRIWGLQNFPDPVLTKNTIIFNTFVFCQVPKPKPKHLL